MGWIWTMEKQPMEALPSRLVRNILCLPYPVREMRKNTAAIQRRKIQQVSVRRIYDLADGPRQLRQTGLYSSGPIGSPRRQQVSK